MTSDFGTDIFEDGDSQPSGTTAKRQGGGTSTKAKEVTVARRSPSRKVDDTGDVSFGAPATSEPSPKAPPPEPEPDRTDAPPKPAAKEPEDRQERGRGRGRDRGRRRGADEESEPTARQSGQQEADTDDDRSSSRPRRERGRDRGRRRGADEESEPTEHQSGQQEADTDGDRSSSRPRRERGRGRGRRRAASEESEPTERQSGQQEADTDDDRSSSRPRRERGRDRGQRRGADEDTEHGRGDRERTRGDEAPRARGRRSDRGARPETPREGGPKRSTTRQVAIFLDVAALREQARDLGSEVSYVRVLRALADQRRVFRAVAYLAGDQDSLESTLAAHDIEVERCEEGTIDVAIAVDALALASKVDCVVLASGSSALNPLAQSLRSRGLRVESASFLADPGWAAPHHQQLKKSCLFVP